jgi:hypothetical protein
MSMGYSTPEKCYQRCEVEDSRQNHEDIVQAGVANDMYFLCEDEKQP